MNQTKLVNIYQTSSTSSELFSHKPNAEREREREINTGIEIYIKILLQGMKESHRKTILLEWEVAIWECVKCKQ